MPCLFSILILPELFIVDSFLLHFVQLQSHHSILFTICEYIMAISFFV